MKLPQPRPSVIRIRSDGFAVNQLRGVRPQKDTLSCQKACQEFFPPASKALLDCIQRCRKDY